MFASNSEIKTALYFGDAFFRTEKKTGNDTSILEAKQNVSAGQEIIIFSVDVNPEERTEEAKANTIWIGEGSDATQSVLEQISEAITNGRESVIIRGKGMDVHKEVIINLKDLVQNGALMFDVNGTLLNKKKDSFATNVGMRNVFTQMLVQGMYLGIISGNSQAELVERVNEPLKAALASVADIERFVMYANGGAVKVRYNYRGEMILVNLAEDISKADVNAVVEILREAAAENFGLTQEEVKAWQEWFNYDGEYGQRDDFLNVQFTLWEQTGFNPQVVDAEELKEAKNAEAPLIVSQPWVEMRDGVQMSIKLLPKQLEISSSSVGGIDLNDIAVDRQGFGVDIQFDPVEMQSIIELGIDGFAPVIINLTPLPSVLPLLGLEPRKKEEYELSQLN